MVLAPKWRSVAALAVAASLMSCDSDDPGILGVGDELGRTTLTVEISPSSVLIPVVGGQEDLEAIVRATDGSQAAGLSVTWTSLDPDVASVGDAGLVTALAEGTARVEAKVLNLADTATVTVSRLPASLTINTDDILFAQLGASETAEAQVFDANGEPLDSAVSWTSSNSAVATVDAGGTITATGEGLATITAVARSARDQLRVQVDTGVAALQVSVDSITLEALEASTWFTVSAVDVLGDSVTDIELDFSVANENVAEISGDTLLIARAPGSTELTVRVTGTSLVERIPVEVDQKAALVNLFMDRGAEAPAEPDTATVDAFTSFDARVEAFDANGFTFTPDEGVVWTNSDASVLALDTLDMASAFLQFTDPGTATVVATVDGAADSLAFTVVEPDSLTMALDADTLRLFPGESAEVTPIFATPDSADRCCGQAVWTTSDASVVTVSDVEPDSILVESSVSVEAMGAGSAWVTATRGSLTDSVYVHVSAQGFNITVVEGGTENVADALSLVSDAARRWEEIVIGDLPSVPVSLEAGQCQQGIAAIDAVVDDLMLIVAPTTGSQSSVNPCVVREDGGLPAVAVIFVDAAALEATGFGEELALHLVGHALGFGLASPWDDALSATGSTDPRFTGAEATAEYQALGSADPDVPLQDTTQAGALDEMHWHETTFGAEIMTGAYVESVAHEIPLSRVTVGALTDLGYETAPWRADAFTLTLPPELVGAETLQIDERLWRPIWTVTDTGELAAQGAPAPAPPR